jgi:peptidoglycan L-alanyl-D-glutamate endopeptidase CwlK
MTFVLGSQSLQRLEHVDDRIVKVAKRAITETTQDFTIETGWRSNVDQMKAFLAHTSQKNGIPEGQVMGGVKGTGMSQHQLGKAVDATPWVNGKILWAAVPGNKQWDYIYPVADAFRKAAIALNVKLRWGGVWDMALNDIKGDLKAAVAAYTVRHKGPDMIDGPHFEVI